MSRHHLAPVVRSELAWIQPFVDAGVLNAVDIAFATFVHELLGDSLGPTVHRRVVLAAAMASRAPQQGHVAVDLGRIADTAAVDTAIPRNHEQQAPPPAIEELPWPDPEKWKRCLARAIGKPAFDGVIRGQDPALGAAALMVYDNDLLYLDRYYHYEAAVAQSLKELAWRSDGAAHGDPNLAALFPDGGDQAAAAHHALTNQLTVIAGGPGTGKTFTLTRTMAALLSASPEPLRIGIAAPTGKAASRMKEAIKDATLSLDDETAETLQALEPSTIHRMLGYRDGIRFRHDRSNPLPLDVVVIDEVSMVSLSLMGRLVDAIGADTRLILVGDPSQLASVEAGAVLGDITSSQGPVGASVVTLTTTHRFGSDSGIGRLAEAIDVGDASGALEILNSPGFPDVNRVDTEHSDTVLAQVSRNGVLSLASALAGDAVQAMAHSSAIKVLAATRRGPNGREEWQRRIETAVRSEVDDRSFVGRWYVGRPVIVTNNDYLLKLFNGDTGIVIKTGDNQRSVVFPDSANPAPLKPAQIGQLDTWWAMTIHKSQGSEFDHAVVALPEPGSPVLSRELLYTGVTRAKSQVTVVGTEAAVRQAIETPVRRASGLSLMLR
ncbi:MAG: exodeoxyribonuclease V subunit alpha [Acidimicrobiales bacterium]|nr:exodeoxyribonuclease V subunit alpha [Acidimicrobiales bacterium]